MPLKQPWSDSLCELYPHHRAQPSATAAKSISVSAGEEGDKGHSDFLGTILEARHLSMAKGGRLGSHLVQECAGGKSIPK